MKQYSNGYSPGFNEDSAKAFTYIYNTFYPTIYQFVSRYIDDAEQNKDIIADVFLKLWKVRDEVASVVNLEAYLKGIAKNCCLDHLRKVSVRTRVHKELLHDLETSSETAYWEDSVRIAIIEYVAKKIESLPPKHQLIYRLSFVEGLDIEEIADRVQLSKNTVRNIRFSIIKFLRLSFNEKDLLAIFIAVTGIFNKN